MRAARAGRRACDRAAERGYLAGLDLGRFRPRARPRAPARRDRTPHARRDRRLHRRAEAPPWLTTRVSHAADSARATPCADPSRASHLREVARRAARLSACRLRRARDRRSTSCFAGVALRERPARLPEVAEIDLAAPLHRARRRATTASRQRLLPAGLVHDEVQPQDQRATWRRCRASPICIPTSPKTPVQGALELMHDAGACGSPRSPACARHAAAGGRRPRRAHRHADDAAPTTATRRRRRATRVLIPDSAHGTNPASAAMAGYRPSRSPERRARRRRPRRPARLVAEHERHRRPDAHQPQHAGPVRDRHRSRSPRWSTRPAACSTTTAPTSTPCWAMARPGDMGFDVDALQPAQDVLHAARRRRPGRRAGGGVASTSSRTCRRRW